MDFFVTDTAYPFDLQRFRVVRMVSVRCAFDSAARTCGRTFDFTALKSFAKSPAGRNLRCFTALSAIPAIIFGAVLFAPFLIGFAAPSAMLFSIFLNVFAVALVYFLAVRLPIPTLLFKNLCMFSFVVSAIKGLSGLWVFEWHKPYLNMAGRV